ncbi:ThiF family adenylyltransferase [Noviherbaspirillum aridicola]|uniref:ThiF family adenylyltransferase n=1 Tax=Noviherbaspirillum aridicola TaxID=2849687 RepID=UPI001C7F079A|nr:ThiF family adenylyltransferase [Noviherbaspirillum aridicola]
MAGEHEAIARLAADAQWLSGFRWGITDELDVCVNVDIAVGDRTYEVRLIYPDLFPDTPAIVQPRGKERLSSHQYGYGGALCLEWGPDNWTPDVTGAMLLESAYKLLSMESEASSEQSEVLSRHRLTEGQRLRQRSCRLVLTEEFMATLAALGAQGTVELATRTLFAEGSAVAIASPAKTQENQSTLVSCFEMVDLNSWPRPGLAIVDERLTEIPTVLEFADLKSLLATLDLWPWSEEEEQSARLLVLSAPGEKPRVFAIGQSGLSEYEAIEFPQSGVPRAPASHIGLSEKSVAIVGLGSVGSKVAVSLARAGVGRFVLVDEDILAPHNLVRHAADWREVGLHKATAASKAIKLISPLANVYISRLRLAGQENAHLTSTVLEKIGACDLVVDATASPNVLALLSAVCSRRQTSLVWGELFAGGYGGMMARSRPGYEADGLMIRNGINQYFEQLPPPPEVVASSYDAVADNRVLIASDADVSQLAAAMGQFSLDTLGDASATAYPYSAYLMGFRAGWIFTAPFHTIPLEVAVAKPEDKAQPSLDANDPRIKEIMRGIAEDINADDKPSV